MNFGKALRKMWLKIFFLWIIFSHSLLINLALSGPDYKCCAEFGVISKSRGMKTKD